MGAPLIPFSWWPGHWGLKGQTRDLARIDYNLHDNSYTRSIARTTLLLQDDPIELKKSLLAIEMKYGELSQKQYDTEMLEFEPDDTKKAALALDLLLKQGDITQLEYEKEKATVALEPWFHFTVDYANNELELKVDCNDLYIEYLRTVGYGNDSTASDDDVIYEYVRDFGRKLSEDHPEDDNNEGMLGFIKTERNGEMVTKR